MKADLLHEEFAPEGVPNEEGRLLLEPGDAVALIGRAVEEGVPVLGVEGVRVAAGRMESPPGQAADYAAVVAAGHGCWAEAEVFVRERRGQGLVFAVALGDDPVEAV